MPTRSLRDKSCVITGAASGIGRATALAAAREGARLVLTDVRGPELEQVVTRIRAEGGTVLAHRAFDIADYEAVRAFAAAVHEQLDAVDVVMNVAGVSAWGAVDKLEHRHWKRMVDVNLMGPIHVIECFVPPMIAARRGGHLVNVSSAAGLLALPWHAAYSASKFGLRGISDVLRFDLARHGIGVSLVCPGAVETGLVETVDIVGVDRNRPEVRELVARFQRHAVSPEHVAKAILRGIEKNRYLVFTSNDIRIGFFFAQKFPWPYEMAMRLLQEQIARIA